MLRLSLINSSQHSLSLHNNIKSSNKSVWGVTKISSKKSFKLAPTLNRQWAKLFIHLLTRPSIRPSVRPSVRSFVRSFVHSFIRSFTHSLTHSLTRSWFCHVPAGIHSYVQSCMHVSICPPFYKTGVSSCRYKGNVLCQLLRELG